MLDREAGWLGFRELFSRNFEHILTYSKSWEIETCPLTVMQMVRTRECVALQRDSGIESTMAVSGESHTNWRCPTSLPHDPHQPFLPSNSLPIVAMLHLLHVRPL